MIERNRLKTMAVAVLLLAGGFMLLVTARAGVARAVAPTASRPGHPILVYESERAALRVSISRHGDRIIRAGASAPGLCSNGEKPGVGFELTGGTGYPIHPNGVFARKRGPGNYLRGRFVGDKVIGTFRDFYRRNLGEERVEPYCGNIEPRGRNQHFVAHLVEVNGKKVRNP